MGTMNENDVVIHEGLSLDDQLYLSTPDDTAGISRIYLPQEVVQKYNREEQNPQGDAVSSANGTGKPNQTKRHKR